MPRPLRLAVLALAAVAIAPPADAQRNRPDPDGPPIACAAFGPRGASAYVLPYPPGAAYEVWATTSHFAEGNGGVGLYAVDFRMPIGAPVVAARAGVVVAARDSFADGNGVDLEENFVFVQHADGTVARYFHLTRGGALVAVGERVRQGQRIGRSGNSGQSAGPHLHFDVQACGPNLPPGYNRLPCGRTQPVNFRNTAAHPCGLRSGLTYRAR